MFVIAVLTLMALAAIGAVTIGIMLYRTRGEI